MSQRCDGGESQLSCLLKKPWPQPGPILSFYHPRRPLEHQPRICGGQPTHKPAGKRLFQEERGIYNSGPRRYSQPRDVGQPQSPHRAASPPGSPCQHSSHQGWKQKPKFPSACLAGTFHWLRLFWAPRRRHCSFSLGWELAHIRTCHRQEEALGVSAQANEWSAIFNVWFLSVLQKARYLCQSDSKCGLHATTSGTPTWVLPESADSGVPSPTGSHPQRWNPAAWITNKPLKWFFGKIMFESHWQSGSGFSHSLNGCQVSQMPSSVLAKWGYQDKWHAPSPSAWGRYSTGWRAQGKAGGATGAQRWETSTLPGASGQLPEEGMLELRPRGWGGECYGTITPYLYWPLVGIPSDLAKTKMAPNLSSLNPGSSWPLEGTQYRPWRKRRKRMAWTLWEQELGSHSCTLACTYALRTQAPERDY